MNSCLEHGAGVILPGMPRVIDGVLHLYRVSSFARLNNLNLSIILGEAAADLRSFGYDHNHSGEQLSGLTTIPVVFVFSVGLLDPSRQS